MLRQHHIIIRTYVYMCSSHVMGVFDSRGIKWRIMARAKKKFSEIVPKLIFRDGDSTGGETLKETKVSSCCIKLHLIRLTKRLN